MRPMFEREAWDWPPRRHRRYYTPRRRWRYYRTYEDQPSGWSSPIVKKVVRIYWRVMITIIKALLVIPLSIMAIGAFWLLWIIITL